MIRNILFNIKLDQHKNLLTFCLLTVVKLVLLVFFFKICKTRKKDYLVIKRGIIVHMDKNVHSFDNMHFNLN